MPSDSDVLASLTIPSMAERYCTSDTLLHKGTTVRRDAAKSSITTPSSLSNSAPSSILRMLSIYASLVNELKADSSSEGTTVVVTTIHPRSMARKSIIPSGMCADWKVSAMTAAYRASPAALVRHGCDKASFSIPMAVTRWFNAWTE